jgi:hypothetical protein
VERSTVILLQGIYANLVDLGNIARAYAPLSKLAAVEHAEKN